MVITFILVNPAVPANIGAAARAMKTMGFSMMRLVNPCDHLSAEARMLAHGSNDILESAKIFSTLKEAVADQDFVIGTTARHRTKRVDYFPAGKLTEIIQSKGKSIKKVAMIFGSEESGLSNEDLTRCDLLSFVPMAKKYPSLNLSQAVMVFAYELSVLAGRKTSKGQIAKDYPSWKALKMKTEPFLEEIGIHREDLLFTRIMERFALLGETDVHLLHSIIARIDKKKDGK